MSAELAPPNMVELNLTNGSSISKHCLAGRGCSHGRAACRVGERVLTCRLCPNSARRFASGGHWLYGRVVAVLHSVSIVALKAAAAQVIVAFSFLNAKAALLKACLPGSKGHGCHIMHTIADDE